MKNLQKWLFRALILALLCGLIGSTYAKYVKQDKLEGTVTIKASLGTIELLEHEAVRIATGEYELTETLLPVKDDPDTTNVNEADSGNEYILLPGLDVPKDPFVRITDKSPIEAYVYVEVVSSLADSALTFAVDADNWTELTNVTGKNGGTVYVYTGGTNEPVTVTHQTTNISEIYILKDNQVIVSQKLNSRNTTNLGLTFYASMYEVASVQKTEGETILNHATRVYNAN